MPLIVVSLYILEVENRSLKSFKGTIPCHLSGSDTWMISVQYPVRRNGSVQQTHQLCQHHQVYQRGSDDNKLQHAFIVEVWCIWKQLKVTSLKVMGNQLIQICTFCLGRTLHWNTNVLSVELKPLGPTRTKRLEKE